MKNLLSSNVQLWVSGHTHQPKSMLINNIPLISNPVGSPDDYKETFGFNRNLSYIIN